MLSVKIKNNSGRNGRSGRTPKPEIDHNFIISDKVYIIKDGKVNIKKMKMFLVRDSRKLKNKLLKGAIK